MTALLAFSASNGYEYSAVVFAESRGNAVVPAVAYVIGSAILAYDAGLTGSVVEYVDEMVGRGRVVAS